jgi:hypothetical protein
MDVPPIDQPRRPALTSVRSTNRRLRSPCHHTMLTTFSGRPVLSVGSAFVINVQSGLEPDFDERSEAHPDQSSSASTNPFLPTKAASFLRCGMVSYWGYNSLGPPVCEPTDVIVGRIRHNVGGAVIESLSRHSGGSMIKRRGDLQCKPDGQGKPSFHLFIALPTTLQTALLFLTRGLSRHMWSINTSFVGSSPSPSLASSHALGLFYI